MSAYKQIKCSFSDREILILCLKEIGYEPVIYKEKKQLMGYQDDVREEKAEIIIPRNQISSSSNDIGFACNPENKEYVMLCLEYDLHKGFADKIKQSYAVVSIKTALKRNKFTIGEETKNKQSKITINAGKII